MEIMSYIPGQDRLIKEWIISLRERSAGVQKEIEKLSPEISSALVLKTNLYYLFGMIEGAKYFIK